MNKLVKTIIFSLILLSVSAAQTSVSLQNVTYKKSSDTVSIALTLKNFSNIGAISLAVKYDTAGAHFSKLIKFINQGTFLASDSDNGEIKISWFDLNPLKLDNDTLLKLVFVKLNGSSVLRFDTAKCEIADTSASVFSTSFGTGEITQEVLPVAISGKVWYDENKNGIIDSVEKGVQWVTVNLYRGDGTWLAWQLTDSSGDYDFKDYKLDDTAAAELLQPGSYFISFYLVDDNKIYTFGAENSGNNPSVNSHAKIISDTTAETDNIELSSGENYTYANAGLVLKSATGVKAFDNNSIPTDFSLKQNYPNPFNPSTTIVFGVPKTGNINLTVYNILGQRIAILVNGGVSAGIHSVTFNASNLNSGIYIYHLSGQGANLTRKMILTK